MLALPVPRTRRALAAAAAFAADASIDVQGIVSNATEGRKDIMASFLPGPGGSNVDIFGDWLHLIDGLPVFHPTADMDVDCDGVDVRIVHSRSNLT